VIKRGFIRCKRDSTSQ